MGTPRDVKVLTLFLALILGGAAVIAYGPFGGSDNSTAGSPYANVLPTCPAGFKEEAARYNAPRAGGYSDGAVISSTWRRCKQGKFHYSLSVTEFADEKAAIAELNTIQPGMDDMGLTTDRTRGGWRPAVTFDEMRRFDERDSVLVCEIEETPFCSVWDIIQVRLGRIVFEIQAQDQAAEVYMPAVLNGDWGVVGDARWPENERIMDEMLLRATRGQPRR